jgi:hypothetical protein
VPKTLDTTPKLINYAGNMEGLMRILPKDEAAQVSIDAGLINPSQAEMYMYAEGNRQMYHHPLRFHTLAQNDQYAIPQSTQKLYPYVLKINVEDRIDTGATYYIRFTIIKQDYKTTEIKDLFSAKAHLQSFPTVKEFMANRQLIQKEWDKSARNKVGDTAYLHNYTIASLPDTLMIKISDHEIEAQKGKDNLEPQLAQPDEKVHIEVTDNKEYIIYRKRNGAMFNYYEQLKTNPNFMKEFNSEKIPDSLINKVQIKLHNLTKIDKDALINMLTYINKEAPALSINDIAIPVLTQCIANTFDAEVQLQLMEKLKKVSWINSFKAKNTDIKPDNLWDAIKKKKATTYISIALRNLAHINPQVNDEIVGLDEGF